MSDAPAVEALGDDALLVRFGERIDAALNRRVHDAAARIAAALPGLVDVVPGYASLGVHYDWRRWTFEALADALRAALADDAAIALAEPRVVEIPVRYDGPDLADVAQRAGLTEADVIARHAGAEYTAAMLGFAPGFAYLLGLDPTIATPRRATPRTRVPAGSVAIGGAQTAVYPSALPGGWNLIGRTPLALFDLARDPPNRVAPGDRVRFRAVGPDEFDALSTKNPA